MDAFEYFQLQDARRKDGTLADDLIGTDEETDDTDTCCNCNEDVNEDKPCACDRTCEDCENPELECTCEDTNDTNDKETN